MSIVDDLSKKMATNIAIRMEQQIRVCIKPKPKFLTEKMWLRIARIFIRIENTQPSFSVKEDI